MMKISELRYLSYALAYLGTDMGAHLNAEAEIPQAWEERARLAEEELSKFTIDEIETLVCGEENDQEALKPRAPNADALFLDAFDGDLSDVLYKPLGCGFAYHDILDDAAARKKALEERKL